MMETIIPYIAMFGVAGLIGWICGKATGNEKLKNRAREICVVAAVLTIGLAMTVDTKPTKPIAQKVQKTKSKWEIKFGTRPKKDKVFGEYKEVNRFMEMHAHNPDAIDMKRCTNVKVDKKNGWLVGCEYFGQNEYGARLRQFNWFIIRDGFVREMLDESKYKRETIIYGYN